MLFGFTAHSLFLFGIEISYYGLIIAIGMALGVFVACKNAKLRGLTVDDFILAACYVLPLAIVGARIYYVIFSAHTYTFVEALRIWDGGLAVYGGVIGGAIGVALFCLIHKKNFLDVADVIAPSLILGQAIGRIGCYFAGCCYGIEVTDESLMWFPLSTIINGEWHLSTFFYESIWNFIVFAILLILLRKDKYRYRGSSIAMYFILYGIGRAWIEALRGDSLYIGTIKVSQLLSILLIVAGVVMIFTSFMLVKYKKIKPVAELKPVWTAQLAQYEAKQKEKKQQLQQKRELKAKQKNEAKQKRLQEKQNSFAPKEQEKATKSSQQDEENNKENKVNKEE